MSSSAAAARTALYGVATVKYTDYEAEAGGKSLFSGDTLTQQYSLAWGSTNLSYLDQPRYYSLFAGYDWTAFNTSVSTPGVAEEFRDSYGKFRYKAEVGYTPPGYPVRLIAYIGDETPNRFLVDIFQDGPLINDTLTYGLEGRGTDRSYGFTLDFYPEHAQQKELRGLPRIRIDFREGESKNDDSFATVSRQTRDSIVSLGKGSNWINYRQKEISNNLDSNDKYEQKQLQIGHVDYVGRRLWTGLTNWISVSADGQLTTNSTGGKDDAEEYDINFQANASRRRWQARTFMNYNRQLQNEELTEVLRLPLFIKGEWGPDTVWHASANAERGRKPEKYLDPEEKFYSNTITAGGTMFLRSSFTLSPSLLLKTSKYYGGKDAYEAAAGVETASTGRFSNRLFINAGYLIRTLDDGYGTEDSKTWSSQFALQAKYLPTRSFAYELKQTVDAGNGTGYLDQRWQMISSGVDPGNQNYLRSLTAASVAYNSISGLSVGLSGSYDLIMSSGMPDRIQTLVNGNVSYNRNNVLLELRLAYDSRDDGMASAMTDIFGYGLLQYRPNRYHESSVRYDLTQHVYASGSESTKSELHQRQTYNYYSRTGVVRNIASITQEFSYKNENEIVSKYLSLSGRYSPTARLSLSGSAKYYTDPYSVTMYYSAGIAANLRVFNASLDYSLAKRDRDDRIEKKLNASVSRSF